MGCCSSKRPDFIFDLFTHTIIVECDEFKHRKYDTTCEIDKLNATFTDLGDRPMILLRFNPDKSKEYQSKITSEKKKEYARQAYLNKKEKLKKEQENENI